MQTHTVDDRSVSIKNLLGAINRVILRNTVDCRQFISLYFCNYCPRIFKAHKDLKAHVLDEVSSHPRQICACGAKFYKGRSYERHKHDKICSKYRYIGLKSYILRRISLNSKYIKDEIQGLLDNSEVFTR